VVYFSIIKSHKHKEDFYHVTRNRTLDIKALPAQRCCWFVHLRIQSKGSFTPRLAAPLGY